MSRAHVALGSTVEMSPRSAWTPVPREISLEQVWSIVGPQVDQHIRGLPLWKVFCLVYIEGLSHGADAATKQGADRE